MSNRVDRAELAEARAEALDALRAWKAGAIDTDKMFIDLMHWIGTEIAMSIQDRDDHGPWK